MPPKIKAQKERRKKSGTLFLLGDEKYTLTPDQQIKNPKLRFVIPGKMEPAQRSADWKKLGEFLRRHGFTINSHKEIRAPDGTPLTRKQFFRFIKYVYYKEFSEKYAPPKKKK